MNVLVKYRFRNELIDATVVAFNTKNVLLLIKRKAHKNIVEDFFQIAVKESDTPDAAFIDNGEYFNTKYGEYAEYSNVKS